MGRRQVVTALAGVKNILRGALLAVAATFLGCAVFFTLPDMVAAQLNKTMPYWFYESEVRCSALKKLAGLFMSKQANSSLGL